MKHLVALLALGLAACGCIPPPVEGPGLPQVTLVGDSITQQYAPYAIFRTAAQETADVHARYYGGTNPYSFPWAKWATEWPADIVVIGDAYVPCCDVYTAPSDEAYILKYQEVVDDALANGSEVFVLALPGPAEECRCLTNVQWIEVPPPDDPDGVHYTPAGADALAIVVLGAVL